MKATTTAETLPKRIIGCIDYANILKLTPLLSASVTTSLEITMTSRNNSSNVDGSNNRRVQKNIRFPHCLGHTVRNSIQSTVINKKCNKRRKNSFGLRFREVSVPPKLIQITFPLSLVANTYLLLENESISLVGFELMPEEYYHQVIDNV